MKNKKVFYAVLLALLISLALAYWTWPKGSGGLPSGEGLINRQGLPTTLAQELLPDTVTLLDFFATWCPYCVQGIPEVKAADKEIKKEKLPLQIICIDIGEAHGKVYTFMDDRGVDYKVLIDPKGRLARRFKVNGIPTYVILDRQGNVVYQGNGFPNWRNYL